mgnify:CR=1 FL=1
MIDLYHDHCPNDLSQYYGVEFVDNENFDIFAFRVKDLRTIKFDCEVRIYGKDEDLPNSCNGRRRRSTELLKEANRKQKGRFEINLFKVIFWGITGKVTLSDLKYLHYLLLHQSKKMLAHFFLIL